MEPYLGEIRCFGFGGIPQGWLPCNGQTLTIQSNQALYALLGIVFGGDGKTNFNLPKLNGVAPMHYNPTQSDPNASTLVGKFGGAETVPLQLNQIPAHNHLVEVSAVDASANTPGSTAFPAVMASPHLAYAPANSPQVAMCGDFVAATGTGQNHPNLQPYLVLNFCIATAGEWPPRP